VGDETETTEAGRGKTQRSHHLSPGIPTPTQAKAMTFGSVRFAGSWKLT
jgi:hypothetical protein